jgi:undecaprenyl-diphosphatase
MDYRTYHAINQFVYDHAWIGRFLNGVETWFVPLFGLAVAALWFLDRPGAVRKWKLASASALASAGLALLIAQAIGKIWARDRPFVAHPGAHVWGARTHDQSFPSDHATASFAIATAILLFDATAGWIFVAAAVVISVGRVFIGVHYPTDILAGALLGIGTALFVVRVGRPVIEWAVRLVERVTDPLVAPFWRRRPVRAGSTRST